MKNGVLKRLGIVLTAVYFLTVTAWQAYSLGEREIAPSNWAYVQCKEQQGANESHCWQELNSQVETLSTTTELLAVGALRAAASAAVIWLLLGLAYFVFSWVRNGNSRTTE